jgi:hypothetical protein
LNGTCSVIKDGEHTNATFYSIIEMDTVHSWVWACFWRCPSGTIQSCSFEKQPWLSTGRTADVIPVFLLLLTCPTRMLMLNDTVLHTKVHCRKRYRNAAGGCRIRANMQHQWSGDQVECWAGIYCIIIWMVWYKSDYVGSAMRRLDQLWHQTIIMSQFLDLSRFVHTKICRLIENIFSHNNWIQFQNSEVGITSIMLNSMVKLSFKFSANWVRDGYFNFYQTQFSALKHSLVSCQAVSSWRDSSVIFVGNSFHLPFHIATTGPAQVFCT